MNKIIIDEITSEKLEALGWTPPAGPEIPEGCPVLVWDECGNEKHCRIYQEFKPNLTYSHTTIDGSYWRYCEIDYTRKGCVIPWNGGECSITPCTGGYTPNCTVWLKNGWCGDLRSAISFDWTHSHMDERDYDIIAYIVWPDYLTIE